MSQLKKLLPHFTVLIGFVVVSLFYFYPVLQGKAILQSDIVQYTGMAKEQNDFRKEFNEEPYWTNSAFGGMPTYQLGAKYPHNYVKKVDTLLRFLPRPADYLFLYFLGFYILLIVLKIDPLKAFFGALAFGFSTYMIIILGVGHNAKAHAIAYMPMVVAGVLLVFQKRYLVGGLLTVVAASLEIQANHFQMTYYLLLLLFVISGFEIFRLIKSKDYQALGIIAGVFTLSAILAIGVNATNLMATAEYANFSTRGANELTINEDGTPVKSSSGMSYEYITEYSYGIAESFNLIAPRFFGGGNSETLGKDSNVYNYLISLGASPSQAMDFAAEGPTYWGDQPIVAAPAYIGALVFFFFILAFYTEPRKIKYAFLVGTILSLFLSWGKNFPMLTDFFINHVPFYNKFRAVSSIQVVLELCLPVLAILGLHSFFKADKEIQWKAIWKTTAITVGIVVVLLLLKGTFSFQGQNDAYYSSMYGEIGPGYIKALVADRMAMYSADLWRAAALFIVAGILLWLYQQKKISQLLTVIFIGSLMVLDLIFIGKNYVNATAFTNKNRVEQPFLPTNIDQEISDDPDLHYRVFEARGTMNSARASYFHKSIGGYSAVKPRRMQQLYDFHLAQGEMSILNMWNVKYIIQINNEGQELYSLNPFANGNAWFVSEVIYVNNANDEILNLEDLDTKHVAILNVNDFPDYPSKLENLSPVDSLANISLTQYRPNHLVYESINEKDGLAIFSEAYYPKGWHVTIDGTPVEMIRANYALRALYIPAGKHTIAFKFEPEVVAKGSRIALISSLIVFILLLFGAYKGYKKYLISNV